MRRSSLDISQESGSKNSFGLLQRRRNANTNTPRKIAYEMTKISEEPHLMDLNISTTSVSQFSHRADFSINDPSLMTQEELRIFNFLENMAETPDVLIGNYRSRRRVSRVYTSETPRTPQCSTSNSSRKFRWPSLKKKLKLPGMQMPPIYSMPPLPLIKRDFVTSKKIDDHVTDQEWEELSQCRYLRHGLQKFRQSLS